MAGKTAKYYANNPSAREKKKEYDTEYHKTPARKRYRAELNKANRKAGTYGNGDNEDMSHTRRGGIVKEPMRRNRARNGAGNNKRLK